MKSTAYPPFEDLKATGAMQPHADSYEAAKELLNDAYLIITQQSLSVPQVAMSLHIYFAVAICTPINQRGDEIRGATAEEIEEFVDLNIQPLGKFVQAITHEIKIAYLQHTLDQLIRRK